jgi:uncharacterized protein (DUF58 family)
MKYRKSDYSVSSYFVIPLSLIILGLVAFVAAAKASEALARFSAITLVLMLALRLNGRLGLARLNIGFNLEALRLFRGEEFALKAEIRNAKILPVWLKVSLDRPDALVPLLEEGVQGESTLLPFEKIQGNWRFKADRRGVYSLGPAKLSAGDILNLYRREKRIPIDQEIIVYPRLLPIHSLDLPFREYFGAKTSEGIVEDPAWYEGTREYTGSRSARAIHWKASARLGELQEKIFQPSTQRKVLIIVDGEGFAKAEDWEGFERALEIAASLASAFAESGAYFSVATDRSLKDFSPILPLGRGPEHLGSSLELLARCEPSFGQGLPQLVSLMNPQGAEFVVIAREAGESIKKFSPPSPFRQDRLFFVFSKRGPAEEAGLAYRACSFKEIAEGAERMAP